jgi:predicted nuclease of restriction endonuclease-like (RecB) superfamily
MSPISKADRARGRLPESAIRLLLEFLNPKDESSESDLENALITELERFLLELGNHFTIVARQRRLRVGTEWYRVDLLVYHQRLRCPVVFDLKMASSRR